MANVCVDTFVDTLTHSALLEPEQVDQLSQLQEAYATPRQLAQELIRRDWLTAYQANQLFLGRGEDLVLGPYVLLERIGEGGMGQVFKARQRKLGRIDALKIIRRESLNNPKAIPRFEREIRSAARLSHPNIVRAYDADNVHGVYYFAMEYVDGVDLARLIKQQGPVRVEQACDYMRQAASGLQHAYEQGMVHRDIKPANLLVTRNEESVGKGSGLLIRPGKGAHPWGIIKILDMGLARWEKSADLLRSMTHLTQLGSLIGTPEFIAPEQARDCRKTDIRGDLYSLGCTFYYILAGKVPFPDGSLTEKLLQHQLDEPEPVEEVRANRLLENTPGRDAEQFQSLVSVPPAVTSIIRKLMAKRPEDRYQTPAELVDDLTRFLENKPVAVAPASVTEEKAAKRRLARDKKKSVLAPEFADLQGASDSTQRTRRRRKRLWMTRLKFALAGFGFIVLLVAFMGGKDQEAKRDEPQRREVYAAEKAWDRLVDRHTDLGPVAWRNALIRYRRKYPDEAHAAEAGKLLVEIRSPFDDLKRDDIAPYNLFAWQPDELVAVFGRPQQARRWQAATAVAASPDGRFVVTGLRNGTLRISKVTEPQKSSWRNVHSDRVTAIVFTADGQLACSTSDDGRAVLRNATDGDEKHRLDHGSPIVATAFAPQGESLVTASEDGQIHFWNVETGKRERTVEGGHGLTTIAFAPDGQTLFWSGESGKVRWLHLGDGQEGSASAGAAVTSLQVHPQGRLVAWADSNGRITLCGWNGEEFTSKRQIDAHSQPARSVAFTPSGDELVSVGNDRVVSLWNVETGQQVDSWQFRWPISQVAFGPNGRHVITANANSTAYVLRR